ncbi:glycosyltransferase family 2 protein [Solirubrobacter ginsenosidimutans]|uniref:Glycosyltransferase family 2 protein n=1 Tax=Solirubrobacter ginsenosidimutans TaxID=490573 RepID=A0A9X3S2Q5_9ACTN|nr:glycosyltransferase family 2 protein [Solirubrobacter ginsenosidimutans]MDA0162527.1 glycosyltransferase family 2 protein [Solirubrobacter ginsenosidimutans]
MDALEWLLTGFVLAGALPLLSGCYQFILSGLHRFRRRAEGTLEREPNVAVVVPAWNEAAVIGRTLDTLLSLDYPPERLRVYVVDDASTDATPDVVLGKAAEYPGRVFHLRRDVGGEGKAHTLNHGLRVIRADGWYEAALIIDADVIFTARSLRRMVRHFGDPSVGAVTGYIKEGSRPANYMNRFISYEYVAAQAGARRAQNVLGAQACLAGGAQLLRRESLEAIGGEIDTSSLAEDTFTTFNVQLAGQRVVFDPHAIVWAEEPHDIAGLWKQRVRWGRGNVQVTWRYRHVWLRRSKGRLGGVSFALIWFPIFLMPALMLLSSVSLVTLYALHRDLAFDVFRSFWALILMTYLFVTLSSFAQDGKAARASWREAVTFPGLVSLAIITIAVVTPLADALPEVGLLLAYIWLSASMLAAYLVRRLESAAHGGWLARPLLYVVGYGPLLCAITAAAYFAELRRADLVWEKTEKSGSVGNLA